MSPRTTWQDVEAEIVEAAGSGLLLDKRAAMPHGVLNGVRLSWGKREPEDILGLCSHQSASANQNPLRTAEYHAGPGNHITPGRPLPGLAYTFAIAHAAGPPWLCTDLADKTWSQGSTRPGDENRHLVGIVVMGAFCGPGWEPPHARPGPSKAQLDKLDGLAAWLGKIFGFGGEGYFGHYHFGKSACPGYAVANWLEASRDADDKAAFASAREWQQALLRWHPEALPRYGADGAWGRESRECLTRFQQQHHLGVTGLQDPFTQLVLLHLYPETP